MRVENNLSGMSALDPLSAKTSERSEGSGDASVPPGLNDLVFGRFRRALLEMRDRWLFQERSRSPLPTISTDLEWATLLSPGAQTNPSSAKPRHSVRTAQHVAKAFPVAPAVYDWRLASQTVCTVDPCAFTGRSPARPAESTLHCHIPVAFCVRRGCADKRADLCASTRRADAYEPPVARIDPNLKRVGIRPERDRSDEARDARASRRERARSLARETGKRHAARPPTGADGASGGKRPKCASRTETENWGRNPASFEDKRVLETSTDARQAPPPPRVPRARVRSPRSLSFDDALLGLERNARAHGEKTHSHLPYGLRKRDPARALSSNSHACGATCADGWGDVELSFPIAKTRADEWCASAVEPPAFNARGELPAEGLRVDSNAEDRFSPAIQEPNFSASAEPAGSLGLAAAALDPLDWTIKSHIA